MSVDFKNIFASDSWNEEPVSFSLPRSTKDLLWYLKFTRAALNLGIFVILLELIGTGVGLVTPWLSSKLLDNGLIEKNMESIIRSTVILGIFGFAQLIVNQAKGFYKQRYTIKNHIIFSEAIYTCFMNLPYELHIQNKTGTAIRSVKMILSAASKISLIEIGKEVINILSIVTLSYILIRINYVLFILGAVGVSLTMIIVRYHEHRLMRLRREGRKVDMSSHGNIIEVLQSIRLVKSCKSESYEIQRHMNWISKQQDIQREKIKGDLADSVFRNIAGNISSVVLLLSGGYLISRGTLTVGALLAFSLYIKQFEMTIQKLIRNYIKSKESLHILHYARRGITYFEDETATMTLQNSEMPYASVMTDEYVKLDNVSFKYLGTDENVLSKVNLTLPYGMIIGIFGPTGAGKSTLGYLLAGLIQPSEGTIFQKEKMKIGYVGQHTLLLGRTLEENIIYHLNKKNKSDDYGLDIDEALNIACCENVVQCLPLGLKTILKDRDNALSGGERQRVAIARELLIKPDLLILDEATSGLDYKTESMIIRNIRTQYPQMSIVLISHRANAPDYCDIKYEVANREVTSSVVEL